MTEPDPLDPRMRGFRTRTAVDQAIARLDAIPCPITAEAVVLACAAGRVLAADITAPVDVPGFARAAMDGYAVRGEETFGSDSYTPSVFRLIGRARPGRGFAGVVEPGAAVEIATGAPLPAGADTVVPVELTERDGQCVRVREAVPPGRHVGHRGEDVKAGTTVLRVGRRLRPQDLGMLSALGLGSIAVVKRPRVMILITGDELLPPGTPPCGVAIADANSPMLAALVERDGGIAQVIGPLADNRQRLAESLRDAAAKADLVLVSGGSSTGPEDHAPSLVADHGTLLFHGVALRPASPTGFGLFDEGERRVPVGLLPGNPVSCLCAYDLFAGRLVRRLGGRAVDGPYPSVDRPLAGKLTSVLGRVDYTRVRLDDDGRVHPMATSGASILSSVTSADGFVLVSAGSEGHPPGTVVRVWLYEDNKISLYGQSMP